MRTGLGQIYNLTTNFRTVEGTRRCMELRKTRNRVPGVVYGGPNNNNKILVHTDGLALASLLKERGDSFPATLVDVKVEDEYDPKGKEVKSFRCVPRDFTLHHLYGHPVSCNWLIYNPERGVTVNLPIIVEDRDKCPGLKRGAVVSRVFWTLKCLVKGPVIPDSIRLSVAGMNIGERKRWTDVKWDHLPKGSSVECLMFRMESLKKAGVKNLTLLSIEGGKKGEEDDEKKAEESLEKF